MSRAHDLDRQLKEKKLVNEKIAIIESSVVKINEDIEELKDTTSTSPK